MPVEIPTLSSDARRSVVIGTVAITLASVTASELATLFASLAFNLGADLPAHVMAGIIPLLLAGPGSYFQLMRLEQVRTAYRELDRVASTDWLTGCLNRWAFTEKTTRATEIGRPGALLVVDADGFKTINERFGHDRGDEALRRIVAVIRANVGSTDLIGRLDGEEFGIYLRDVNARQATDVADAIREGVQDIAFSPEDAPHTMSVSVGIATATSPIAFSGLLRMAEQQLYIAKTRGRNRVAITAAAADGETRSAA